MRVQGGSRAAGGVQYALLSDHLGSVVGVVDQWGEETGSVRYGAWGEERGGTGVIPTDRGYTGQLEAEEVGLYFYNARWYDPNITQFIQPDSIIPNLYNPLDWNRYGYARQNPLMYNDPDGHIAIPVILAIVGIVIILTQVPSDVYQSDPARQGSGDIVLLGVSFIGPIGDIAATSVQCVTSGCDPVTAMMTMLPGPNPLGAANAVDDVIDESNILYRSMQAVDDGSGEIVRLGDEFSTLSPGPYAGEYIEARGPGRDFTQAERDALDEIGQRTGCHTCGTTEPGTISGSFIPDHQPANALNTSNGPQRLYPHCLHCSRTQGGQIREYLRRNAN